MGGRGSNSGMASSGSIAPQPQINPAPQAMPAPVVAVQSAPPSTAPQAMGGGPLLSGGPISYTPLNQKTRLISVRSGTATTSTPSSLLTSTSVKTKPIMAMAWVRILTTSWKMGRRLTQMSSTW